MERSEFSVLFLWAIDAGRSSMRPNEVFRFFRFFPIFLFHLIFHHKNTSCWVIFFFHRPDTHLMPICRPNAAAVVITNRHNKRLLWPDGGGSRTIKRSKRPVPAILLHSHLRTEKKCELSTFLWSHWGVSGDIIAWCEFWNDADDGSGGDGDGGGIKTVASPFVL